MPLVQLQVAESGPVRPEPMWDIVCLNWDIHVGLEAQRSLNSPHDSVLQPIYGTLYPEGASIEHMGVDHGGPHVPVAQQLLHGADVVSIL